MPGMGLNWYQIPAGEWYGTGPGVFAQVHRYDHRDGPYWVADLRGPKIGDVELGYDHCSWREAAEAMQAADAWLAGLTAQSDG